MDRYEQFHSAAIDRGIPEGEVGRFAEHLRFAVWAWPGEDGEDTVGQVGGLPRLPAGVEWPGGEPPLPFIGSVDCAALPRAEGLGLPAGGSLLFFLHHEEDMEEHPSTAYSRVLYVPAGTETELFLANASGGVTAAGGLQIEGKTSTDVAVVRREGTRITRLLLLALGGGRLSDQAGARTLIDLGANGGALEVAYDAAGNAELSGTADILGVKFYSPSTLTSVTRGGAAVTSWTRDASTGLVTVTCP